PVVLHAGVGAGAVRAPVAGRRLCDDLVLPALEHVCAGLERLAAATSPGEPKARATGGGTFCGRSRSGTAGMVRAAPSRGRCRPLAPCPRVRRGGGRRAVARGRAYGD